MRFTTVFSLLFASWTLLSGSPAVHAAPVPSPVDSTSVKRCNMYSCRIETPSESSTGTDTASQSTAVQKLVSVLIEALQNYEFTESADTPSNTTSTVDLATSSEEAGDPSDPVSVIDALIGDADP